MLLLQQILNKYEILTFLQKKEEIKTLLQKLPYMLRILIHISFYPFHNNHNLIKLLQNTKVKVLKLYFKSIKKTKSLYDSIPQHNLQPKNNDDHIWQHIFCIPYNV